MVAKSQLDYARLYSEVGISIFPLMYRDKVPKESWDKYKTEYIEPDEIERLWHIKRKYPNNIAVVGGKISKMVFLDFDDGKSYDTCITDELKERFLVVDTHDDRHHVWIKTEEDIPTLKEHSLDFEVHSTGTYVAAPSSIHPTGSRYKFQKSFEEVEEYLKNDDNMTTGVQEIIDSFIKKLKVAYSKKETVIPDEVDQDINTLFDGYPCYKGVFENGACEGQRDSCAIMLVSKMKNKRVKKGEILKIILEWNERNYRLLTDGTKEPYPLESSILIDKVEKGSKAYVFGCKKIKEVSSIGSYCVESECRLNKKQQNVEMKEGILNQTDKVIMYPGTPAYYEIHIKSEAFRVTTKELMKPSVFAEWYFENFGKSYSRVTLTKWNEIIEAWHDMSKKCKKEKVNDDNLFYDAIVDQMMGFINVKTLDEAIMTGTYHDTENGSGVLISSKNVNKLLAKECKSTGHKMSINKFAVLLKSNGLLKEDSSLPRKIHKGKKLKSVRFWKFSPEMFQ